MQHRNGIPFTIGHFISESLFPDIGCGGDSQDSGKREKVKSKMFCMRFAVDDFTVCLLPFAFLSVRGFCKQAGLRHPRGFQSACFSSAGFPELWQKMRRDQFSFHFLRSAAGMSALFPPSACAIDYQQKQSASGFMCALCSGIRC